jgi:indolepyruvate ferredoxin oxidoreductase
MTELRERDFTLADKYTLEAGELFLTGLQALVRIPLEQSRRDAAAGRRVGILISGYEGSPLAGYDLELGRLGGLLDEHAIVFRPGVNEELAATAVQGSQLASISPSCVYDGVVGIWYGKAPGLDRATDALRHAGLGGAAGNGGALVLVGDDSTAKSSTVPSSSEVAMAELGLAILAPSDPQEIIEFGLHGIALSRFSGLWAGMKLATNIVDGSATVRLGTFRDRVVLPSRTIDGAEFTHTVSARFLQPALTQLEQSLVYQRRELARRYITANNLNRTIGDPDASLGIVTAGAAFRDTLQALERLGLSEADLQRSGIRILKLGAISPLDHEAIQGFAEGLEEVVVVEEKRAFIELGVKDALYGTARPPRVLGKFDEDSRPLLRGDSDLPPELLADKLGQRIRRVLPPELTGTLTPGARDVVPSRVSLPLVIRTPYFCSGCPHNRSTVVPDGSLVGAGIGCHALAALMPEDRVGAITGLCQMGGEGASWIGMAPFVAEKHLFQNLGDGTFHHSGSLAVRAAVASGVNITYKLLYNDAVAMTGGQSAVGKMAVPQIVRELLAEGVRRVVITTDDVGKYRKISLPRGVDVLDRSRLVPIQEELAAIPGVTVLIHDQECATGLRRKRKRGVVAAPATRVFINERVCEGCGDCGQKSNCMSVQPVGTEFGRKTKIDQTSCNTDYSCLDGDCPSFVVVEPGPVKRRAGPDADPVLPEPDPKVDPLGFNVRITGVGGTGVVTTAQVLGTAGTLAGLHVRGLDQLGLAQKGGAVVSDLKFSGHAIHGANKVTAGDCDLYLGCDLLVAAEEKNLTAASGNRTISVISTSQVPTGSMILAPGRAFPALRDIRERIESRSRGEDSVFADARAIAYREFGSDQFANMILVGMAVQAGALPIPVASLEKAIGLNGVAVPANLRALRIGREHVVAPPPSGAARELRDRRAAGRPDKLIAALAELDGMSETFKDRVGFLAIDLVAYQDQDYALKFVRFVADTAAQEQATLGAVGALSATAAESMYKLMAYKDEYEVARLYLDPEFDRSVREAFGDNPSVKYKLHPPVLRSAGLRNKISLGPWFKPVFTLLRAGRHLRGTPLDLFGYAHMRKLERELISQFAQITADVLPRTSTENADQIEAILALPQEIRGYESVKLDRVAEYRAKMTAAIGNVPTP